MLFLRVIAWCGDEKFSLKKSCFYLYIRRWLERDVALGMIGGDENGQNRENRRMPGRLLEVLRTPLFIRMYAMTAVHSAVHSDDWTVLSNHTALLEAYIDMRYAFNLLVEKCSGLCGCFDGDDENGYRYVMGGRDVDVIAAGKAMNEALDGRGGGSKEMFQGSLKAAREQIEEYFANL